MTRGATALAVVAGPARTARILRLWTPTVRRKISNMQSRLLAGILFLAFGGCVEPHLAPLPPQAAMDAARIIERALEPVFGPLDQKSTTLNPMPPTNDETAVARLISRGLFELQARMEQRLLLVDALKDRQVVGENSRGYLEARASLQPQDEKVVSDENADRREVYLIVAANEKTDAGHVGRLRAQQIALTSKRGVWMQGGDGVWDQKP